MEPVIEVRNLSKKYRLGDFGRHTFREELDMWWGRLRRKNGPIQPKPKNAEFWALRDVSFDVKPGEVLGIIGRNGAGKSTLLKILSRITEPTSGEAVITGRVASLLEVGTGFHPELTGRENVYLNGAILGMKKREIDGHFDGIVDFAGVEQFIDTPVKRYSSGMYVRLAFAVAAYLEPEILIVDEVLAVGDAEFQRKCLGKLDNVAKSGRAVLFVSHNMPAILRLANRCILLEQGVSGFDGDPTEAVRRYGLVASEHADEQGYYEAPLESEGKARLSSVRVHTSDSGAVHRWGKPIRFEFALEIPEETDSLCLSFQVVNEMQYPVCSFWLLDSNAAYQRKTGTFSLFCDIAKFRLYMGRYTLKTYLADRRANTTIESLADICPFEVSMEGTVRLQYDWTPGTCAYLEESTWSVKPAGEPARPARREMATTGLSQSTK